ncbi:MAG: DNA polymerase III subunit gamma/tau [Candidatus Pacebacteria bacterium]|nr:DNA polymerase III subunit gamma/tau [Candidatus Paceibacterota bacterium]
MEHTALYRKYRPETFEDVLGQDHVITTLRGALHNKTVAHAYLFAGTRGTGKTSIARIFARELGCSKNDIYEIDAASNRGIDDIRALRDAVQTRPLESPYKVYIIDEVHMLTKDAFNALLKTLEEPPQHVIFILATTELHKVLDTVISRCQVFRFNTPGQGPLVTMLQKVAAQEGYDLAEDAAEIMSLLSDGSFRDAQGVLQKVLSAVAEKKITREMVEPIIGVPQDELVEKFTSACASGDTDGMLGVVQTLKEQSYGMHVFLLLVLRKVRLILSLRYGTSLRAEIKKELSAREYDFAMSLIGSEGAQLNAGLLAKLLEALQNSKFASIQSLPLEMFVFGMAEKSGGVEKK